MDLTAADADERQEWQDAPYKDIYSLSAGITVMACHDLSEVSPMDARLIAASPDLLSVLDEFVEDVETSYQHSDEFPDGDALEILRVEWPDLAITYEKAVKAIAKAKGVQS
jgi:hypothetical protein